jgi:hypothetical protein
MMLATNQYGEKFFIEGTHPRKELSAIYGTSHVDKMYVDRKDGGVSHIGYIIAGNWIQLYMVEPWENRQG